MTKYTYIVEVKPDGAYTTVTRISDGATKTFFNAGHKTDVGMIHLMESITDELAEGYFPKPRKK